MCRGSCVAIQNSVNSLRVYSFFSRYLSIKTPYFRATTSEKKIKVLKCFFSGEICYIFFSFLWERKAKKYVMHEQLETLLSKNGYSLKFKSCMTQKCNRKGIQEFTHLQQKTKQLKHENKLLY